jgi:uncharacterized delta-60 repeat protein
MKKNLFYAVIIIGLLFLPGCSDSDSDNYILEANAGPDQNVTTGSVVLLDGSDSYNSSGARMTYSWTFDSLPVGSSATISDQSAVDPTFTADIDGSYDLSLVVNGTDVDAVTITASSVNSAPVANAGVDQNVSTGSTVTLNGSGSSDADLDALTYSWSMTSAPATSTATLSDSTVVNPTFDADLDGSYVLQLIVNDGTVDGTPDTVVITASTESTTSGILDSSFGSGGVAIYSPGNGSGSSITLDNAGNSYVTGAGPNTNPTITRSSMYVWKYDSAGVLDNTFSSDGIVTYDNPNGSDSAAFGSGIALDSAGNVYVTGSSADINSTPTLSRYSMAVWKYKPDGTRDTTFGTNGVILNIGTVSGRTDRGYAIALDSSDNLYVVGASGYVAGVSASSMVVWKYDSSGAPDTSFGNNGIVVQNDATGQGITLDNADNIYVTGSTGYMTIWKYDSGGTLDTSFGTTGIVVHNNANARSGDGKDIALDNAGNIYVSGYSNQIAISNYDMVLWKYRSDGTLDLSFATAGFVTYDNGGHDQGDGIVLDNAANIYVTGYNRNTTDDMVILKYDSGGALDASFGTGGVVVYDGGGTRPGGGDKGHSITLDSANGIYVAGSSSYDMAIWKYK